MKENEPVLSKTVIGWAEHFGKEALGASRDFILKFRPVKSLHLSREQTDVFMAYFAHYWVLKKNIEAGRWTRDPMNQQLLKVPLLNRIYKYNLNVNDGVNFAGKSLLEMAQRYSEKLKDGSRADIRNAANLLSSICLEGLEENQLNQKIDRALSRIKINKVSSASR